MTDRTDDAHQLIANIVDELGMDAYHLYPDSRRLIGEAELAAIAVACIVAYCKGFFNLEVLGTKSREYLLGVLGLLQDKQPDSQPVRIEPVIELLENAGAPIQMPAIESLKRSMIQFGMTETLANEHAENVAALIQSYVKKP
jgi:hypothetical protein